LNNLLSSLIYIDATGYHYPDYPTLLAFAQSQYTSIYGADTYLGADSMDGQWLAVQAQNWYDTASLGAQTYNSFSPTTAMGVGLSQVVQINGIQREVPSNSSAVVTIIGQAGTVITNGVVQDINQNLWNLPSSVTIPTGGSIAVTATAQEQGDITAQPDTITTIYTPTLGWQSVSNAAEAVPGSPVETDAQLRARQQVSTANPSVTVLSGTQGAVSNVVGVSACRVYENYTNATDGNGLPPHSICVVCQGGDLTEIATEIMLHKTPGTQPYAPSGAGYQTETVLDPGGLPITIAFYNPPDMSASEVEVAITIQPLAGWTTDSEPLIQAAVAAYINGLGIGNALYAGALFAPALLTGTSAFGTFQITQMKIAFGSATKSFQTLTPAFNAICNCNASTDVSITVA
jgi:hypothetical protein